MKTTYFKHFIKTISIFILLFFILGNISKAATITTNGNGNWNSTVPNAPWPNGIIPQPTDDVIIGYGHTLTINVNATVKSVSFNMPSNGTGSGILHVNQNVKLNITDYLAAPILNGVIKKNSNYFITGQGSIEVPYLHVGNTNSPSGSADAILYLNSSINELIINEQLIITSIYRNSGQKIVNSYFNLESGTLTVNGNIVLTTENTSSIATFNMSNNNGNSYLLLTGQNPFDLDTTGTSIVNLNGTGTTVEYSFEGDQEIYSTTYSNLIISGSGIKTADDVIVNETITITGDSITIDGAPELNSNSALIYEGNSFQTTGSELKDAMTNDIIIKNKKGVILNKNFQNNGNLKIEAEGVFFTNGKVITGTGEFTLEADATIVISSDDGISHTPNKGEIQTTIKNFSPDANYIYKGTSNQVTGNAMPAHIKSLTVKDNAVLTLTNSLTAQDIIIDDQATLVVPSHQMLTVEGELKVETPNGLIIKSDANGSASFIDAGHINGIGTVKVERYLPNSNAYGWTVAAPVKNAQANVFSGSQGAFIYNPLTASWQTFNAGALEDMRGYWTKFANNKTLEFNDGILNTGPITFNNFYRTGFASGNMGWNFIGNPYPSAISWDNIISLSENGGGNAAFMNATKLNSAIYISDNDGGYNFYVNGFGTFNGIIPQATAFWVQVNKDFVNASGPVATAQLTINNSVRLHQNIQNKSTNTQNAIEIALKNNTHKDIALLNLNDNANLSFDAHFDALKMLSENTNHPQIYSLNQTELFALNAIPYNTSQALSIPLGFVAGNNQNLSISINAPTFDSDISIYLEDKLLNITQDMKTMPEYYFNATNNTDNERFVLHLNKNIASVNDNATTVLNNTHIYTYDNAIYINHGTISGTVNIYNLLGQIIHTQEINTGLNTIKLNTKSGYYLVNVINGNASVTEKVLIN